MIRRFACWMILAFCLSVCATTLAAEPPRESEPGTSETGERAAGSGVFRHNWQRYVAYGGLGIGAGLLGAGMGVDLATGGRIRELGEAIEGGNAKRVRKLEEVNRRARSTALALYGTGGLVLIGTGTLFAVDLAMKNRSRENAGLQVEMGLGRVSVTIEW